MSRTSFGLLLASSLVACTFDTGGPRVDRIDGGPGPGDPDASVDAFVATGDDGGGMPTTLRHDSVADFSAAGTRLESSVVEGWGGVGPAPTASGGLLAHGIQPRRFDRANPDDTDTKDTWANANALPYTGSSLMGVSPMGQSTQSGGFRPVNVGITANDNWTLTLEGEVWLEAGDHEWRLSVDDDAFMELATAPGGTEFRRILNALVNNASSTTVNAPATGWYPIHIAASNNISNGFVAVQHKGPRDPELTSIPPFRLRPPPGTLPPSAGLLVTGYDINLMINSRSTVTKLAPGIESSGGWEKTVGILDRAVNFAARWTGQIRIDVAGAYRFRVTSDDGHRFWLDGARHLDSFASAAGGGSDVIGNTPDLQLEVGWHDIAVDLRQEGGPSSIKLEMFAPGATNPVLVPTASLRPTLVRAPQIGGALLSRNSNIPDNETGTTYDLSVDATADGAVESIDVFVNSTHENFGDVEISVRAPDGTIRVVAAVGAFSGAGSKRLDVLGNKALQGKAAAGTWSVTVKDLLNRDDTGTATAAAIVVHYRGGETVFARRGVYESAVLELGKVVGFDKITWSARTPLGSSVAVRARACATADACAAEPWSDPLTSGARPPLLGGRAFFQYQVELVSDGNAGPSLDSIDIAYRK